jgi:hypothetical protein
MKHPCSLRRMRRYSWVWLTIAALASFLAARGNAAAAERRAAIEIGSKGVKMTVIELTAQSANPVTVLQSAAVNTTIAAGVVTTGTYSPDAIRETADAAGDLVKHARDEFGLGLEQIRVIGSSGLPRASNRGELVESVRRATGLGPMEFITPAREVQLTIAGLVPNADWPKTALVDIGSGNTKGGFLRQDGEVVSLGVPLGSVTFADRVTKDALGKPFDEAVSLLRRALIEAPLTEQARLNPELMNRPTVFLSGGAPYAMTTLMHPGSILQPRVSFTSQDILRYRDRLRASPRVPSPDFSAIDNPKTREAAEKEFGKVRDTFTRENLVAGAEIMDALASTLQLENKTLIFDRNGVTAWLRAILDPSMAALPGPAPRAADTLPQDRPATLVETVATKVEAKTGETPARVTAPAKPVYPSPQSLPSDNLPRAGGNGE